jgi:hypothetical protein
MKYNRKYPIHNLLKEVPKGIVQFSMAGACDICGCYTHWVNIKYQSFICSEECNSELEKRNEWY